MAHLAGEENKKQEKFLRQFEFPVKKRPEPPQLPEPTTLVRGCTGCPYNKGHTLQQTFGPIPRVKVRCEVINGRLVRTHPGENHEDCHRRHHVLNKKMDPLNAERKQAAKKMKQT